MHMKPTRTNQIARAIAPYVATILSISLAVTLRVEHACSDSRAGATNQTAPVMYPYPEMIGSTDQRQPGW
jgi:hypothetical protein